jgi:hypothetical protein
MSQCHDTYEFAGDLETQTARIDFEQHETAVCARATMTVDGRQLVGRGEASCQLGEQGIAARSASAQALVALADALVCYCLCDVTGG